MTLTVGSLFSGIGGLDLGLQRAGMEIRWQVENDNYCRRILAKHWQDVPKWSSVETFPPFDWPQELLQVDVICAGWPCQDISSQGKRAGLKGKKSGLFFEVIRVAGLLKPRVLLLENTSMLLRREMGVVLGELAQVGFNAEWHCIPAASLGAPHVRDRCFTIGTLRSHPDSRGLEAASEFWSQHKGTNPPGDSTPGDTHKVVVGDNGQRELKRFRETVGASQWATQSSVDRILDGVPRRVQRIKALGNSVCPQVAEFIGRLIVESVQ